jgi:pimeloyl-ACP methyl ester carboxylesterase
VATRRHLKEKKESEVMPDTPIARSTCRLFAAASPAIALVLSLGAATRLTVEAEALDQAEPAAAVSLDGARRPLALTFSPCAENPRLDCGTLMVPVDYDNPHGDAIGIAVIRARATSPGGRIGVMVGNPGGPGISGVDFVLGVADAPGLSRLRQAFDIVSFDPRGVKRSRRVRCTFALPPPPSESDDAGLEEFFDELGRRHAQACLDQNGSFVTHIGTVNVARDIDMIRRALGETQITYAAGSYGSQLGATYASLYPKRVRAMLLDGGIAPEFRDFSVESWSEYSRGFEMTLQRLDQLCRRDPDCRLRDTGAVAAMDELLARLAANPVAAPNGGVLTAGRVQGIMATLIGSERNWPLMVDALADAQAGSYAILFQLLPVGGASNEALFPILCNDHGTRRPAADYLRTDAAVGALNPRFFGRFFVAESVALCASWPAAEPPEIRNVANQMATPILIVANDFDPNTPLVDARGLAHALGMESSLLRYEGGGHTAFFKNIACIDAAIETYLIDRQLPAPGSSCPAQPVRFGTAPRHLSEGSAAGQVDTGLWSGPSPRVPTLRTR